MKSLFSKQALIRLISLSCILLFLSACSSTSTSGGGEISPATDDMNNSSADNSFGLGVSTDSDISSDDLSSGDTVSNETMITEQALASTGYIVYFDFDTSTIRPDARETLMIHAAYLKQSGKQVTLEGHADERGTREYNMALGERRAKAVRDFLVIQGVNRSQLGVVSFGEERPASYASNPTSWAKNRRVEIR